MKSDLEHAFSCPRPLRNSIAVRSNGCIVFIPTAEIVWIEAERDYVRFHAGVHTCLVRMTLGSIVILPDATKLLRIHRSAMVNTDAIARVSFREGEVRLRDGTRLPLGKTYRPRLRVYCERRGTTVARAAGGPREVSVQRLPELLRSLSVELCER
jgi:two-component system LytT family response regulator